MVRLKPVLFLIVCLLHLSLNGKTQAISRLGIELGLVSSTSQEFTSIYGTSYSAPSLISPVLGVKWLYSISKYFEFSGGLQYEMYGLRNNEFSISLIHSFPLIKLNSDRFHTRSILVLRIGQKLQDIPEHLPSDFLKLSQRQVSKMAFSLTEIKICMFS